jgi:hypothetical protein
MRGLGVRWLYTQLPELVAAGVLTEDTAGRIRAHYGEVPSPARGRLALTLVSVLGAGLIGLGIVLLIARNWDTLDRATRVFLAMTPLAVGHCLGAWVLVRRATSAAWREGVATYIPLASAAAIALVSQTYHIAGDLAAFHLTWSLLALPLIYLFRSTAATLLYFSGILLWASASRWQVGHAVLFWPLAALALPHVFMVLRKARAGPGAPLTALGLAVTMLWGAGLAMHHRLPGLWIIVYAGLFGVFAMLGRTGPVQGWGRVYRLLGDVGTVAFALLLTMSWTWRGVGNPSSIGYYELGLAARTQDYVLALGLPVLAFALGIRHLRVGSLHTRLIVLGPLLAAAGFALPHLGAPQWICLAAFNGFSAVLGLSLLVAGLRDGRLGPVYAGLCAIMALVLLRFFDSDLSFAARGVAFIVSGCLFLAANLWLARRLRGAKEVEA